MLFIFKNVEHATQNDKSPLPPIKLNQWRRTIQTVKETVIKARLNSENQILAMISLTSQSSKDGTSPDEKLFSHKLTTTLVIDYTIRLKCRLWKTYCYSKPMTQTTQKLLQEQPCDFKLTKQNYKTKKVLLWV